MITKRKNILILIFKNHGKLQNKLLRDSIEFDVKFVVFEKKSKMAVIVCKNGNTTPVYELILGIKVILNET